MDLIRSVSTFFSYWYFRYTLVTELYMVEKWERNFIPGHWFQLGSQNIFLWPINNCWNLDAFMVTVFTLLFLFNYKVLMPATTNFFAMD